MEGGYPVAVASSSDPVMATFEAHGAPGSLILPKPFAIHQVVAAVPHLIGEASKPHLH